MSFEELAALYERDVAARSDKPKGVRAVRTARNALVRAVPALRRRMVTRPDLAAFRESLVARGRSPATVNAYLRQARAIVHFGVREKRIADPELRFRELMLKETRRDKYISPAEVAAVLEAAERIDARLYPVYRFQYAAGARIQELLQLRWSDVDLVSGRVRIANTDRWSTKTREGRGFYVAPETLAWLAEYRASLACRADDDPVFQMRPGRAWTEHFYKVQRRIFRAAGRDPRRGLSHALRHASITDMLHARVPLDVVMSHHGHRNVSTTLRYAHASDEALREAASELARRRGR